VSPRSQARAALILLTALNFFNYIDRYVLFAVQPLVQQEFKISDFAFGRLTSAFFFCYMFAAPLMGWLADRYPRRVIIALGALLWSGATLLTAVTHTYTELLVRHTIVGIGEASFAAIAPAFLADLFGEERRGRILSIFYIAIPVGSACGYMIGGYMGHHYGWRTPFYVGAAPGFFLALSMFLIAEPKRGAKDTLAATGERASVTGLARNPAFLCATLGMAMLKFALGGVSAWMPTFLSRVRGIPLDRANLIFGALTGINGVVATLFGGFLGDRLLRKNSGAYYLLSAASMGLAIPTMALAIYVAGPTMFPAIFVTEFVLFLNNGPLNAAIVNSVAAPIRATAIAVNLFIIHLLGDAFSPALMGWISDRSSLAAAFGTAIVASGLSCLILWYGARFAPKLDRAVLEAGAS
jgi:MFS transporter, Spinster family, sphingosine-1-phosphate transporter